MEVLGDFQKFTYAIGEFNSWRKYHFPTQHEDPKIHQALERIWGQFVREPNFPHQYCKDVSQIVTKLGFPIVHGVFEVDYESSLGHPFVDHWWCEDRDRIIELTAGQFNMSLWPQNWLPSGILIIDRSNSLFKRYHPGGFYGY